MSVDPASASGEAERVIALIADPDRLRVFSALALGAGSLDDVVAMTGLDVRTVERALARLVAGDLVAREPNGVTRLRTEELLALARDAARRRATDEDFVAPDDSAQVLRRFVRGGRLSQIPMQRAKRLVVLDYLAQNFEPGRSYAESEVNEILGRWHEDVAALRRYLVDEDFMARNRGRYWRSGGTVEIGQ
jgi:hypothetical protein